ncbi:hypothetical protein FAM09_12015 [Niastella caeni]|uniref:Uncharacterized protein n=1 Tax=Niastella caeni TaxID=2569763 RepID=A0A4S8I0Q1_9BACT|nr:hypothetical protein [Niastella caeni]THU39232.1 hypothetical protein FAM09_12015 [Niastella caeni]
MNYAKVLDAALQLFPRKINVTCINGITGKMVGKYKIGLEQLPSAFDKPVTLEIAGHVWRVVQANPVRADDFSIFKKLTLHVLDNEQLKDAPLGYNVPTQHMLQPAMTTNLLYHDYTLEISQDDWLQMEFLPVSALPQIQEELALIDPILLTESGSNPLLGYDSMHIRNQTANLGANIPFDAFCAAIKPQKIGNLRLKGNRFIENGFALQSDNYEYYGTVDNGYITHLCLPSFDCIDDEFSQVATTWELLLVNWCSANVIMC